MENSLRFSLKLISLLASSWMRGVRAARAVERECASETLSAKSSWSSPRLWPRFLTRHVFVDIYNEVLILLRSFSGVSRSEAG